MLRWLVLLAGCHSQPGGDTGAVDDGCFPTWVWADGDGDGFGAGDHIEACKPEPGQVGVDGDCDDADPDVRPDAVERCNGKDDDCDGEVDETDAVDAATWYIDADGDGYGDAAWPVTGCEAPAGAVADAGDCNDADPLVNPGADDVCNRLDDNCDDLVDWGLVVPDDHATIGAAIEAAEDGQTICVEAGTWSETIDFSGKDLAITSYDGSGWTVLDGGGSGPVVDVVGGEAAALTGFTVTGGDATEGAAIHVVRSSLALDDVDVVGNQCSADDDGCLGVLTVDRGSLIMTDVAIRENGIALADGQEGAEVHGLLSVVKSTVDWQGGSLSGNTFSNESAGAVYVYGAALYADKSELALVGVDIDGNRVETTGKSVLYGLVLLDRSEFSFSEGSFSNNLLSAEYVDYGLLYVAHDSVVSVSDSEISGNSAACDPGEQRSCTVHGLLSIHNSELAVDRSQLRDNDTSATSSGHSASAHEVYSSAGDLRFEQTDVVGNSLTCASLDGTCSMIGWDTQNGTTSFEQSRFADNLFSGDGTSGEAAIESVFVVDGTASLSFTNSMISGNEVSVTGTGGELEYGFVYNVRDSRFTVINSTVTGNKASAGFGSTSFIYTMNNEVTTLINTAITGNDFSGSPGNEANLYYNSRPPGSDYAGTVTVRYCDLYDNGSASTDFAWYDGTTKSVAGSQGNIAVDPDFTDTSGGASVDWDLHPAEGSPLVDAGSPYIFDEDGSIGDIGAYGGPYGSW